MRRKNENTKENLYLKLSKVTGDKIHLCFNKDRDQIVVCCDRFKKPIYI